MIKDSSAGPVPIDRIVNGSPPREHPLNERDLRGALAMHARLTRPGSSYEDVAREVGFVVMLAALVWVIVGAPGVPTAHEWVSNAVNDVDDHRNLAFVALAAVIVSGLAHVFGPLTALAYPASILSLPAQILLRLLRTATLLAGIACAGIVALVPANAVAHLLGF